MTIICSDCGREQRDKVKPFEDDRLSHAYCSMCLIQREINDSKKHGVPLDQDAKDYIREVIEDEIRKNVSWIEVPGWKDKLTNDAFEYHRNIITEIQNERAIGNKK